VWYQRYFDAWRDFSELEPVRHISYQDAKRYCDWRQLRLPTEHELSFLMAQKNRIGNRLIYGNGLVAHLHPFLDLVVTRIPITLRLHLMVIIRS
jgi:hypothetical protein